MIPGVLLAAVEVESDPIAYGLKGHSFHIAWRGATTRFDLGDYGIQYPKEKQNPGYVVTMKGRGFKLDFMGSSANGWFWGLEGGVAHLNFKRSAQEANRKVTHGGLRFGYRFGEHGFYLVPWFGLDRYQIDQPSPNLGGQSYQFRQWQPFPTVHLGYSF